MNKRNQNPVFTHFSLPTRLLTTSSLWLVGLMWVLPFLSPRHAPPIPSFYGELMAAGLGLAALAALLKKSVWQPFELPRIALLPLGLAGIVLLQWLSGHLLFPQQALLGMLYLLWAMLLMTLGQQLQRELGWERLATALAWCLLAGGMASALITGMQQAGWHGWMLVPMHTTQSAGNLAQPNHFANYIGLSLVSLVYLRQRRHVGRPVFAAAVAGLLALLALSGSRSAWLYLTAMLLLAWRCAATGGGRSLLLTCGLLLPSFLLIQQVIPWIIGGSPAGATLMPTERLFREVSGTGVRLQIWHEAWQMFRDAPWLGVGFGQFDWNSFMLADRQAAGTFAEPTEHAHNLILHLLAELGIVAGILCLGMAATWVWRNRQAASSPEGWWLYGILTILGVHSLLEYPLWYTYFLGIAAILLGAGEVRTLKLELARVGRPALLAMLLMGGLGLANLTQAYASLEKWMTRSLQGQVRDADLPAITADLTRLHGESLLSPYVELVLAASIAPSTNRLEEKLQLSDTAMRFSPIRQIVFRHALLLALKGDRDAALLQLRRAERAYPNDVAQFRTELERLTLRHPGVFDFLRQATNSTR